MKKLFSILALLAVATLGQSVSIVGQVDVVDERITYGSDSAIQIRVLGGQVHRDTSTSDTSQHWKRQDNTSDSCSNPIWLGRTAKPIWKYAVHEMAYSRDPDSAESVYRFEVRRMRLQRKGDTAWGPWVKWGQGVGTLNDPVQDTVAMPAVRVSAGWTARYGLFFLGDGTQVRVCPDVITGVTGGATTDTLILRNARIIGR